jgi:hypothetical protein
MKAKVVAVISLVAFGVFVGCSNNKYPAVASQIRTSLDQAVLKDVSVSQDRDRGVVTLTATATSDADRDGQ